MPETGTQPRRLTPDLPVTFLVVDDEIVMIRIIRNMLRRLFYQCSIVEAGSSKTAIEQLHKHRIDCIISDLEKSQMGAVELLRHVRSTPLLEQIPFVMVSGDIHRDNITLAGAEGVDSFISKPFPLTVFERKIVEAWNHRYNPSPLEHMLQTAGKAIQERDYSTALRRLDEVLESFSDSARAWTLKGIAERGQGKLHKAEDSLKQAVELNPSYVKAQETLSNLYIEKGDMNSARQLTEKVVAVCPLRMENHLKLAHLYVEMGDADSAETVSKNISRLFPDSGDIRAEIGDALLRKNFNEVAERVLNGSIQEQKKSRRTSPEQLVHVYNRRGIALRKQGKFDEAVLNYLEALQIEPKNPGLHFNLGTAYYKTGKNRQAAESYRVALSLAPDFKEAANALRYLEKHYREAAPPQPRRAAGAQPAARKRK